MLRVCAHAYLAKVRNDLLIPVHVHEHIRHKVLCLGRHECSMCGWLLVHLHGVCRWATGKPQWSTPSHTQPQRSTFAMHFLGADVAYPAVSPHPTLHNKTTPLPTHTHTVTASHHAEQTPTQTYGFVFRQSAAPAPPATRRRRRRRPRRSRRGRRCSAAIAVVACGALLYS